MTLPLPLEPSQSSMPLDLDDLRLLVVLADELHFGRAAARLHLSQPGLSYRLKRMEDQLGYALVARTQRKVELTAAGVAVLQAGQQLLDDAARLVDEGRRIAGGEVGTLRVGFVATALYSSLPAVVRRTRARHPELRLELIEMKTALQVRALQQGDLDLGVLHLPVADAAGLDTVAVASDRVGLALPDDHELAGHDVLDLAQLVREEFVLFPRDLEPHTHDSYVQACVAAGFAPRVAQRATGLQTILGLVASGVGVAFVAESVAANLSRTGVVFRPLARHAPTLVTGAAWLPPVEKPAVALVRDILVELGTR